MAPAKILVLGSGMVARPCVEYLARKSENEITVACRTLSSAQTLVTGLPRTAAISLDVLLEEQLILQLRAHDLVISLVPFIYHARIAELAVRSKKHVVTASYNSPSIQALDAIAKAAGVTILNEVGVDPGIDHLYAIKKIDEVHSKGGKDGEIVTIPANELMGRATPHHVMDGYDFVSYPNRNSVPFCDFYGIPEAHTVIRGSLRYDGNPAFVKALIELGWLDTERKDWIKDGITWLEMWQNVVQSESAEEGNIIACIKDVCKFTSEAEADRIISGLRWMGVLSSDVATVKNGTMLDTLCACLEKLMTFQPGERDLVMLQHKFVVQWADGEKETLTSTLELLGDPKGHSAMSFSVGITCGIATQLLLDGHPAIRVPGVLCPYTKEICDPIRHLVEEEGIRMVEKKV